MRKSRLADGRPCMGQAEEGASQEAPQAVGSGWRMRFASAAARVEEAWDYPVDLGASAAEAPTASAGATGEGASREWAALEGGESVCLVEQLAEVSHAV